MFQSSVKSFPIFKDGERFDGGLKPEGVLLPFDKLRDQNSIGSFTIIHHLQQSPMKLIIHQLPEHDTA